MATNTYLLIFFLRFTNTRKKLDMLFPFLCIVAECQWWLKPSSLFDENLLLQGLQVIEKILFLC
jgi:hypothetical protein